MLDQKTRTPAEHLLGSRARVAAIKALLISPCTLSELARAAGCAKSATAIALRQLEAAGVVERTAGRFGIAESHRDLMEQIVRLGPRPSQEDMFREFIGKWIALSRGGAILASDSDPERLASRCHAQRLGAYRFKRITDPNEPAPIDRIGEFR